MTWDPNSIYGCEAAKVAPLAVQYLQGRCLDIGSGPGKVWPQVIGIDFGHDGGRPVTDMMMDGTNLCTFADSSVDGIFSSHMLNTVEKSKVPAVLHEWTRVLKPDGYLVLYLPAANLIPDGEGHPDTKWSGCAADFKDMLEQDALESHRHGWRLLEMEDRDGGDEASFWIVVQKLGGEDHGSWHEAIWQRNPDGQQRALVLRYGAIGDAFVMAGVLPLLKAQGYHVTVNTQPKIEELLRHDPNIDAWMLQENDYVPNAVLGPYWKGISKRYDKIVNLSESIEGLLLTLPGRINHAYSDAARRRIIGHISYQEHTHDIADVPYDFSGSRFYPTEQEHRWARAVRSRKDGPVIVWCVGGSASHKVYPWTQVVISWLLQRTPCQVILYGHEGVTADLAQFIMNCLAEDHADMSRVTSIAGLWDIRQSLSFAQVADVIVGPETGPLNATAQDDVHKVIYMSHSSADNLTKHWRNTTTLLPNPERAPCYPCHRLHMTHEFCHIDEKVRSALCASAISAETVFEAIALALGATKQAEAAD